MKHDPVCGMEVDDESRYRHEYHHTEYLFCSAHCMHTFANNPEAFLPAKSIEKQKDPVCGMEVDNSSLYRHEHNHIEYLFCSEHCQHRFVENPDSFLHPAEENESCATGVCGLPESGVKYTCPMHPDVVQDEPGACPDCGMALEPMGVPATNTKLQYTCPMHPEVVQDHPGSCPKCDMALEAMTVSVEEDNSELRDMSRRFWFSLVFALPVFVLAMTADMAPGLLPEVLSMVRVQWIEFLLATPVVLWAGAPFFQRGWQSLRTRNLNMFTLIGLGVSVAWLYSVVALLLPDVFPASMQHADGTVSVYFEAASVITALVLLGQVLELRARSRTNAAIQLLLGLAPNTARRVHDDGREEDVAIEQVEVGHTLRIRPG